MKLLTIIFALYFFSIQIHAQDICPKIPKNNPYDATSRLAFSNGAGPLDIGLCWWHSRFQRSALYLTTFKPELPKPEKKELKRILRKLRYMKSVVVIPGFKNIYDFSKFYEDEIDAVLGRWQLSDSFIYFQWVRGIWGTTKVDTQSHKKRMQKIYKRFKESKYITWTMWQLPGFDTHAYLILDMQVVGADRYVMKVIDSNYPTTTKVLAAERALALYPGYNSDIKKIERIHRRLCKQ